jgi:hypothetical protein
MPSHRSDRGARGAEPLEVRARDVAKEIARARSARRLLPWAIVTAAGGGAIAFAAGGGARGAVVASAVGLLFALFLLATAVARCPACGGRLPDARRPGPKRASGPAGVDAPASCPRCRTRFV